jgi:sugar phosphate isomerase/epimerase
MTTSRRTFIKSSALMASTFSIGQMDIFKELNKSGLQLGIQLFSLPRMLSTDFLGAMKLLKDLGYKELELFGPYPFSSESSKKSWEGAGKMLGFSGSGYFGYTAKEFRKILDDHGMTAPSAHTDLDTLQQNLGAFAEAANILGHQYLTLPSIPDHLRKTKDDYKKISDTFNEIGAALKSKGLQFGYHNHGYGIKSTDGHMGLKTILDNTDPDLVFFEMDIFWTAAGGVEPLSLLEQYPNRYKMLHIKDMKEKKVYEGDGGSMRDWFPLFPMMTPAGEGVLGVEAIIAKAKKIGVEHFFVEQDMVAQPEVALKKSGDFVKRLL